MITPNEIYVYIRWGMEVFYADQANTAWREHVATLDVTREYWG